MVLKIHANITLGPFLGFTWCLYVRIYSFNTHDNCAFSPRCFWFLSMFPMFFHLSHVCFSHSSEEFGSFLFRLFFSNRHVFSLMFPMFVTFSNHFPFCFCSHVSCICQKRPKLFFLFYLSFFFQCSIPFFRWFFHCMFIFCFFPPGGQEEVHVGTATWWQAIFVSEEQRAHSVCIYIHIYIYI